MLKRIQPLTKDLSVNITVPFIKLVDVRTFVTEHDLNTYIYICIFSRKWLRWSTKFLTSSHKSGHFFQKLILSCEPAEFWCLWNNWIPTFRTLIILLWLLLPGMCPYNNLMVHAKVIENSKSEPILLPENFILQKTSRT